MASKSLNLRNFFLILVISAPPSLLADLAFNPSQPVPSRLRKASGQCSQGTIGLAVVLVTLPVFVQAPLVHALPLPTALLTLPLLIAGGLLGQSPLPRRAATGAVLVGFAGSWLGGSLFWGWLRLHPLLHLPIEALALPLALAGLRSRWRLAGSFYLASLLGTASTDAAIAMTGLMPLWPQVLAAKPDAAADLLQTAAAQVLDPHNLFLVLGFAIALLALSRWLYHRGECARLAAATLVTTLAVDAIFLLLALAAPAWSGLI